MRLPDRLIMPGGEPFFFPGNEIGCLLVHGLTGAPNEMRWMGEHLSGQGYTVLGVRLPGHGTRPEDLKRVFWTDWLVAIEDGLTILRSMTRQQFLFGLSLGGVLSLLSSARYPVDGCVSISAPFALPDDWRIPYIRPLSRVMPRQGKGVPDWHNPDAATTHVEYPYYPTVAIAELRDVLEVMRASLPSVNVPVLLVHSRQDKVAPPGNVEKIYNRLGTTQKQLLWVENSGHVVIREPEREKVFAAAVQFIEDHRS